MSHWVWLASLSGILSTEVVFGTDMFFLTIGCSALRFAFPSAVTEVMGFLHLFADARMPVLGVMSILSNLLLLAVFGGNAQRWFYVVSLVMLILFVILYNRVSKPINRLQTEAAKSGKQLSKGRELQERWDKALWIRVPLLTVSLIAQCLVLVSVSM